MSVKKSEKLNQGEWRIMPGKLQKLLVDRNNESPQFECTNKDIFVRG